MDSQLNDAHSGGSSRRRLPWILGGICALVAFVVVIAMVIGSIWYFALRETPRSTVEEFFAVWESGDCEHFTEISTPRFRGENFTCENWHELLAMQEQKDITFEDVIENVTIDGDRAIVRITQTKTTGSDTLVRVFDYELLRRDGDWLLDRTRLVDVLDEG